MDAIIKRYKTVSRYMHEYTYVVRYWKRTIKILRYFQLDPRSTNTTYITRENIKDNFRKMSYVPN